MKKILLGLFLLIPLTVIAEDGFVIPQWEDYAPPAYVDVKKPKGLAKINVITCYWYQRKVDFESSIEECNGKENPEEKYSCYESVKSKQYQQNSDYNARMEARANAVSNFPEMMDRTDTMLPINGYLDQLTRYQPNELQ